MLPLVRQLGALPAEEFDTVVRVGVVAGADDHAEAGPLGPGQIGNARGRQRTEQHHIDTRRIEARLERALEHVARNARVLADQHRGPLLRPLQYPADGMRQPQNEVGSDGRFAHRPADAVGAEIGTDGIRGTVGEPPITPDFVLRLAHSVGRVLKRTEERPTVLIGKDTRISGYMLESALESGFNSAGVDVVLLGPLPTPGVAYLTRAQRASLGVVISASHNPYADNGIKFFSGQGTKLPDEWEHAV